MRINWCGMDELYALIRMAWINVVFNVKRSYNVVI